MIPNKLKKGDEIRVIAPARSMSIIRDELKSIADKNLSDLGFKITFGDHVNETDDFRSSSIASRVTDLHSAFSDKNVKAILTVIGGFNSNQLLGYIDWDLIKKNPKIFCGYSDITALGNAIYAKTGLATYSGPHYSSFGQKKHMEYTIEYFEKCLLNNQAFDVEPSKAWTDDPWYKDQNNRHPIKNQGCLVISEGEAKGTILGANLCTLNLLQGTEYMPNIADSILFIEDDSESVPHTFDRDLQSLIHQPGFSGVKGMVIGRFQNESNMTNELLTQIIKSKKELDNMPVIANVDFGHTDPRITFPIGGKARIVASGKPAIRIIEH